MRHDSTATACDRLQHQWELHGHASDLRDTIHRIVQETAPVATRAHVEAALYARWEQLTASAEGDDDDYTR